MTSTGGFEQITFPCTTTFLGTKLPFLALGDPFPWQGLWDWVFTISSTGRIPDEGENLENVPHHAFSRKYHLHPFASMLHSIHITFSLEMTIDR